MSQAGVVLVVLALPAVLAAASASCLTEVTPPVVTPSTARLVDTHREPPTPAPPMAGPKRPEVRATPVDLATLPEMQTAEVEPDAGFTLYTQDVDPVCPEGHRPRRYVGMGIRAGLPARTVLEIGDVRHPFGLLDGKYDGADELLTKARLGRGKAVWTSIVPKGEAIDVTRYEGRFDDTRWHVVAKSKASVRPRAIVPGAIYAYRRGDALGIIAPPTVWTSWSEEKTPASTQERFTLFEIPLRAGQAASLTLVYEHALAAALHTIVATAKSVGSLELDAFKTVSVEVVWPTGGPPEVTVYSGSAHAQMEQIAALSFPAIETHCVNLAIDF